jgi:hypothetical protein
MSVKWGLFEEGNPVGEEKAKRKDDVETVMLKLI